MANDLCKVALVVVAEKRGALQRRWRAFRSQTANYRARDQVPPDPS
jgi:hypothetical protein